MPNKKMRSWNRQVRATAVPGTRTAGGSVNPNGVSIRQTAKKATVVNSVRTGQWKTPATWGAMRGRNDRAARRA